MNIRYKWSDSCKWLDKENQAELKELFKKERAEYDTFSYNISLLASTFCFEWQDRNIWKVTQIR